MKCFRGQMQEAKEPGWLNQSFCSMDEKGRTATPLFTSHT